MMAEIDEDNLFAIIIKGSLGLLVALTVAAFTFFSNKMALGILAGGFIAIINFLWLRNVIQRILGLSAQNANRYALVRYFVRISVTGVALYFVLTSKWFSLAGVLTGLSVIVANIITVSLYRALSTGG